MTEIVAKAPDTSVTTQNSSGAMWRVIQSMSLVAWAVGDTYGRGTHRQAGEHSRPAQRTAYHGELGFADAGDCHIGFIATPIVQHAGVHHTAHLHIHLVGTQPVQHLRNRPCTHQVRHTSTSSSHSSGGGSQAWRE